MAETYEYYYKKYGIGIHNIDSEHQFLISKKYIYFMKNSQFHRIDGPAKIWDDGAKTWGFNGKAVAMYDADGYVKYWRGPLYDWAVKQGMDIDNLTDEDKLLIKMVWG